MTPRVKDLSKNGRVRIRTHYDFKIEFTRRNQERMAEETGIQPSLTDEDVKTYLEQVIKEVKKPKMSNDGNNT